MTKKKKKHLEFGSEAWKIENTNITSSSLIVAIKDKTCEYQFE